METPLEQPIGEPTATAVAEQPAPGVKDRTSPVLVTGASGLVGTHACRELARRGWRVRALVRDQTLASRRLAGVAAELRVGDIRDGGALAAALAGCGAVVHLAAIAIERAGESYEQVNAQATATLLDAARGAGVDRFVHMSQNGASSTSPFRFLRSKGEAEDLVRASALRWTILRPSVIFGPEDAFVNVLARLVRLSPGIYPVPGGGRARFQPIAVDDVARAVATVLEREDSAGAVHPLGGPAVLTLRDMVERVLLAMHAKRILVGFPVALLRPVVAVAQRVLPHPPVTTALLDLLAVDNTVPDNALSTVLGITPMPFAPEEITYLRAITLGDALRSIFG